MVQPMTFEGVFPILVTPFDDVGDVNLVSFYGRYLPLIAYEQQPGVAVRKEIYRLRGLIASSHVRHPGASIDSDTAEQLDQVLESELPDIDMTQPLEI